MPIPKKLLPSLTGWNNGAGITPDDWIWIEGTADHALGYSALFWPDFEITDDFVLRALFSIDRLANWKKTRRSRRLIENAMNLVSLEGAFTGREEHGELYEAQIKHIAKVMADMWQAKLYRDFPDRKFSVLLVEQDDDFGVTFHQL